ncbi:hypothetical protein AN161_19045 [Lysinibacillus sp. FJAT-14222]|nr:hypothetical protein AN161_19045 [Lysinibacillus sp. FJAT-14222]
MLRLIGLQIKNAFKRFHDSISSTCVDSMWQHIGAVDLSKILSLIKTKYFFHSKYSFVTFHAGNLTSLRIELFNN